MVLLIVSHRRPSKGLIQVNEGNHGLAASTHERMGIIEPVNLSVDHVGESRQTLFVLLHGQGKRLTALGKTAVLSRNVSRAAL